MKLSPRTTRRRPIAVSVALLAAVLIGAAPPEDRYFPEGVFDGDDKERNERDDSLFSEHLKAMKEPSLWALSRTDHAATVYRLLWVPSFHHSISVRVVKSGGSYTARAVKLGGADLKPGKILDERVVKLTEDQWTGLLIRLERCRYWKMSSSVKMTLETGLVLDGDHLVCEGVADGKYHLVTRNESDSDYAKLGRYMLFLSGFDIKEAWEYYHEVEAARADDR